MRSSVLYKNAYVKENHMDIIKDVEQEHIRCVYETGYNVYIMYEPSFLADGVPF